MRAQKSDPFPVRLGLDVAHEPTSLCEWQVLSLGTDLVLLARPYESASLLHRK